MFTRVLASRFRKSRRVFLPLILISLCLLLFINYSYCRKCECHMYVKHVENTYQITVQQTKYTSINRTASRDQSPETNCKTCNETINSKVIIQYGPPRTASTLQYQILCIMTLLAHEMEPGSVGCHFNELPSNKYSVIKTHTLKYFFESLTEDSWVFMTTNDTTNSPKWKEQLTLIHQRLKYLNKTVKYISDIRDVSKRGYFIAFEYQPIFGLSERQMTQVLEYLRYWDILRLCCGRQMSMDWRNRLTPISGYKPHHDPHNNSYPACELYDISEVERSFLNTEIIQRFAQIRSVRYTIAKPSTTDGKLDGEYCKRCNSNIKIHHITENGANCI